MKRMEIRASVECLCRVPGAHHVPPTCKQTECMRTAHVGAVRIYEFHGLSSRRASNQEVVIVYSSWPRQILFSRQITFSFFSTHSLRLNPTLPLFSLPPLYHLPSSAASSTLPSVNNSKISSTSPLHIHQFVLR